MTENNENIDETINDNTVEDCCQVNKTIEHCGEHLMNSILESDLFEFSLNAIVEKTASEYNIAKSAALSIVLEQVRDSMRKEGFHDIILERDDFVIEDDE